MRASAPGASQQASVKMKWRVATIGIFFLAIHGLSLIAPHLDRLASNWVEHADKNALEIIWNAYKMIVAVIGRLKRRDLVYFG
jgi:hypothetical protein